jgi:C1A family cysteine protease
MNIQVKIGVALPSSKMPIFNKRTQKEVIVSKEYWEAKDKHFEELSGSLKAVSFSSEYVIPEYTPISNQGMISSCVANSWCDALEILQGVENPKAVTQLSRLFLYWIARDLVGHQRMDKGAFNRAAAHQLNKIGTVAEKWFPYDIIKVFDSPELDLYTMASKNKISSFYALYSTGQNKLKDIEKAIRANHPVIISTGIGDDFINYKGGNHILTFPDKIKGYHAMIIVGVGSTIDGKKKFLLRNSWSRTWGDNGYVWFSDDYILNDMTNDLWVGTNMKII